MRPCASHSHRAATSDSSTRAESWFVHSSRGVYVKMSFPRFNFWGLSRIKKIMLKRFVLGLEANSLSSTAVFSVKWVSLRHVHGRAVCDVRAAGGGRHIFSGGTELYFAALCSIPPVASPSFYSFGSHLLTDGIKGTGHLAHVKQQCYVG